MCYEKLGELYSPATDCEHTPGDKQESKIPFPTSRPTPGRTYGTNLILSCVDIFVGLYGVFSYRVFKWSWLQVVLQCHSRELNDCKNKKDYTGYWIDVSLHCL